jgi:hypothetical protein
MVDEATGRVVDAGHKGRGYELTKGKYVEIDEDELKAIHVESTHTVEIDGFVLCNLRQNRRASGTFLGWRNCARSDPWWRRPAPREQNGLQSVPPLVIPKVLSSVLQQAIGRRFVMPLYLKVVPPVAGLILGIFSLTVPEGARSQQPSDAIAQAQTPKEAPMERPEQKKTAHDLSDVFNPSNAVPSSEALTNQQDRGQMNGFDFFRDPLGATRPGMTFDDFYRAGVANKPQVMATQRRLLENRYNLEPRLDPVITMSRDKPIAVGPAARLPAGMTWEALAALSPAEIRERDIFPYKALPHAAQGGGLGGQVFPQMQIKMFPRLERYDVEFDLPEAFLPEFPPAMFLQNRPELGDVSRGEVVSINNYYRLFKDILTAVQLDGLRLLVTPFPQEEFNPTDDRRTVQPSLGVTCLDCHTNGHTSFLVGNHSRVFSFAA